LSANLKKINDLERKISTIQTISQEKINSYEKEKIFYKDKCDKLTKEIAD
jgi:hypothetical protein